MEQYYHGDEIEFYPKAVDKGRPINFDRKWFRITIYDLTGKEIVAIKKSDHIMTSNLPAGKYILSLAEDTPNGVNIYDEVFYVW